MTHPTENAATPGKAEAGRITGISALLRKEWLAEQRGAHVPIIVSLFIAVLVLLDLMIIGFSMSQSFTPTWETGFYVFRVVGVLIGFILGLILPIISATSITGEKEKRTWDLLRATSLSEGRIILGKHVAALGMAVFMLLTALPCFALVFILGGVRPDQFLIGLTVMILAVGFWSAVGTWVSTQFTKSLGSIATILGLYLAAHTLPLIFFASTAFKEHDGRVSSQAMPVFLYPVLALFAALPDQRIAYPGFELPLFVAGIIFLVAATYSVLLGARTGLTEPERMIGASGHRASGRAAGFIAILIAVLPFCAPKSFGSGGGRDQYAFFAMIFLPFLLLIQFPLTRTLSASERIPGLNGYFRAIIDPRALLRARTSSIPLFQLAVGASIGLVALIASLVNSSNSDSGEQLTKIGTSAIASALTIAAWSCLAFGAARRFGSPRLASAIVLFLIAFLIVTSFIPGLPHHGAQPDRPTSDLLHEFARGLSPAYFPIVASGEFRMGSASPDPLLPLGVCVAWQGIALLAGAVLGRKVKAG